MKLEEIKDLINLVKENKVNKFKYKDEAHEIELDFSSPQQTQPATQIQNQATSNPAPEAAQEPQADNPASGETVNAPMVGTFFLQDTKELTEPIVKVGDKIKKGDVIGYIEAMKVMNEVTSEVEGEVTDILVDHGTNVEYDQALIEVK
ncbi:acetyl-CoA carboxylase biotin carboxyl carrier protein subunit [Staphylococcus simulans]|uniref:acetyl-CoA carboxylase biotin carboxyl carrier protein n=1 Tax=Staphylococcus TaxID=1279 RepID=UPI0008A1A5BD|nr:MULTISPECIES: acetyl-CoA carboxylase biotin carboxyl carrier protein subunit [Staphylococcus]MDK7926141.1 acetyl-CoA carboxylase biotin carboxyl carrier protein subunit [Staphylococcus simulans]MDK8314779.1 acetyl-CoA carboxylase biotin carboxyl carrier protein subunit [Staphylococcus simulans]MDQ7112810.1 acetyl-CoA carboxylase biotin carboxyl carrier protein subunit [Staphylococcus simulans]MDQ7116658.1 acetyl-CoA carboxylase biotin carboxyl carrier protein subunit [Staphylococcus simulans